MPRQYKMSLRIVLLCCLISAVYAEVFAAHKQYRDDIHMIKNTADLDMVTFDKVLERSDVLVVMFLSYLAKGYMQTEYIEFAERTSTNPRIIAATVGVMDTMEQNNWELVERYSIHRDEIPVIKLFVNGKENATFTGEWTADNFQQFVTGQTGLWLGSAGTLQFYDELVETFIQSEGERKAIIERADRHLEDNLTEELDIQSASYYLRIMEEYMRRGPAMLNLEMGRLKQMQAKHRSHEAAVCAVKKQINILNSFRKVTVHPAHDEL